MAATKTKRLPRKGFQKEFGFDPVVGESAIREFQRGLERTIVARHLFLLWRAVHGGEPQGWMHRRNPLTPADRVKRRRTLERLTKRYKRAMELASKFNLHPDQSVTA